MKRKNGYLNVGLFDCNYFCIAMSRSTFNVFQDMPYSNKPSRNLRKDRTVPNLAKVKQINHSRNTSSTHFVTNDSHIASHELSKNR